MKRIPLTIALATALGFGLGMPMAQAGTFNYHGNLLDAGHAANGTYEMRLTLYSAANGGSVMAGPTTVYGVAVNEGSFVTSVDFGPLALTSQGWLGVEVKSGGGDFVALDARSPVAPEGGCPGSWALDGNAGIPSGTFLGTVDDNRVEIRTAGNTVARFEINGSVGLAFPFATNGDYSTAIGYNAGTFFEGSIVTGGSGDPTFSNSIRDSATNQVILVAQHGVGINTSKAPDGTPLRDELTIAPSSGLPGGNADLTFETSSAVGTGFKGFNMAADPTGKFTLTGLYSPSAGNINYNKLVDVLYFGSFGYGSLRINGATSTNPVAVGTTALNGNGAFLSGGGVWTNASSRTFKDAFASVDAVSVLDKLVAMPVMTWFYKGNHDDGKHIGPVAEDFAEVFGFGGNEKYIGTVDESGVALAAIQGLNTKLEAENAGLHSKLDALTARLDKLESRRGE